jgi:cytochrome c5
MTEHAGDHEHESPIKTPKQLIVVILFAFLVPIIGIVLVVNLITGGRTIDKSSPAMSPAAVAARIKPVGEVVVVDANAPKVERTGEEIVTAVCGACHITGAAGAPKIGDKAAWYGRLGLRLDGLTQSAIKGKNAMPARGGSPDLSDIEIARAVVYMANKSGASFKEPAAKPAEPAAGKK